jgi:hypothetical protein
LLEEFHNGLFPKCLFAGFSSSDPESVIRHRGLCAVEIQYSERHIPILKNKTTLNRIGGIATPKFNNGSNLKIRQRLSEGSCE